MRVAYLHYLVAGDTGQVHVRQFAEAARALGHAVDVRAMNLRPGGAGGGAPSFRERARRRLRRFLHEPKELLWNLRYARLEGAWLERLRPDVLLVRDHLFTASSVAVARRLRLPLVLEMNAPADESRLYFDEYAHLPWVPRRIEAWKLRRADAVTVVSSALKAHLVRTYGVAPERITVAPNGADLKVFRPGPPPQESRRAPGDGPVVGFVGSFRKWHGVGLLAGLMREAGQARPALRFLLVGDGPESAPVRDAAEGLGPRAILTGRVPHDRVPGLVAGFDIGVLPAALPYGSPLKLIEWMAAGKAVVAPRLEAIRDVIEDGVHGLLFEPGDGGGLLAAVLRLADDPALRRRLGGAAAARARSSFTWEDNARRVLAACARAARGAGRAASAAMPAADA